MECTLGGQRLLRGFTYDRGVFQKQKPWRLGRPLHRGTVSLHRDLDACIARDVGVFKLDVSYKVGVQIAIFFLHIDPAVDLVVGEELLEERFGRFDARDGSVITLACGLHCSDGTHESLVT